MLPVVVGKHGFGFLSSYTVVSWCVSVCRYTLMVATEPLSDATWAAIGLGTRPTMAEAGHTVTYCQRTHDGRLAFGGRGPLYVPEKRTWGLPFLACVSVVAVVYMTHIRHTGRVAAACFHECSHARSVPWIFFGATHAWLG